MIRGNRVSAMDRSLLKEQHNRSAEYKLTLTHVQQGTRRSTGSAMLSDKCIENVRAPVLCRYHNILERFIDHTLNTTRV